MTNSPDYNPSQDDYAEMFAIFAEQSPEYSDSDNREYYESLSSHEFYDAEELRDMRSRRNDGARASDDLKQISRVMDDIRQSIRVARVGFSQAPPPWVLSVTNDNAALVREAA